MTRDEIVEKLNSLIDDSISKINGSIPTTERKLLEELQGVIKDLDFDGNRIKVTAKNISVIGSIKKRLRKLIMDANYQDNVKEYLKTFNEVSVLQGNYMRLTSKEFKLSPVLKEVKQQAIQSTVESLTEQGLDANIISRLQDVLRVNITSGGMFKDLMEQVRVTVMGQDGGEGILNKYVKQVTTDAINQYSRNYLQIATDALDINFFQYTGSNIKTTRCFCHAMTDKRFFHRAEIPALLAGDFDEFTERDCSINPKTKLPDGMVPGTNAANFLTFLGGFNCSHRAIPVPTILVPKGIKEDLYLKFPAFRPKEKEPKPA